MKRSERLLDGILKKRRLSHVLFWAVLVLLSVFWQSLYSHNFRYHLIHHLTLLPIQLAAAYLLVYVQVPRWWSRGRYLLFFVTGLAIALFFGFWARVAVIYVAEPFVRTHFSQESLLEIVADPIYLLGVYVPAVYTLAVYFLIARTIKDRYAVREQLLALREEKLRSELEALKNQIHPHFLFNTLNNLYALTLNRDVRAPEVVAKLSDLLSFLLYEGGKERVPIHREVQLLEDYLDLERLRYGEELHLEFATSVDEAERPIAPLLLIGLVENAFKHGERIEIGLQLAAGDLTFRVKNAISKAKTPDPKASGIGLENLRRQLKLIYPDRHRITTEQDTQSYQVTLNLQL